MLNLTPLRIHQYIRRTNKGKTATSESLWPAIQQSKTYPRFLKIPLPDPVSTDTFVELLQKRRSRRRSDTSIYPTPQQLGTLFGLALREHKDHHRPYPSGGSFYPVECYLCTRLETDARPTLYHYQVKEHVLERLWELPLKLTTNDLFKADIETEALAVIILTARWSRNTPKYSDFAYDLCLLEAGHIGQNLSLAAETANLHFCPIGGFRDEKITDVLELDPFDEQPIYTFTLSN
ncbi:SagB/ThcOx family dehydrogenase [Candidatus Kaiserbacteria bacterium]|nr:SagB/ThcOx family dehydrogenase [Candidatus Kaiserbacteria bacterium]MCB9811541.1 SagB/ThcOx family dehydrogenase [Candidatus Nomurabacteria bacterium]